jgi:rubrerythrin
MVTNVGNQKTFVEAIKELIELDYDAVEAYKLAIKKLKKREYKDKFQEFEGDHNKHIKQLSEFLTKNNEDAPTKPDKSKSLLLKAKVEGASLLGDESILKAMFSNEKDTVTAYDRMHKRGNESSDKKIVKIIDDGLEDEKHHKNWLKAELEKCKHSSEQS